MKTDILIIGAGAREHALGWKLSQSPRCGKLYFAPGNGGTAQLGTNVDIPVTQMESLAHLAKKNDCFTIVGPELPLSLGVVDVFRARGLRIFGPDQKAARLETSKAYAKGFMQQYGIPTAAYATFDAPEKAMEAVSTHPYPLWVKADGLAAGKGALLCQDENEAMRAVEAMMYDKTFGSAGERIVLEEHMEGRELTLMCFTDGKTLLPMEGARDYQRIYDGDEGPNTGGMGCISPVPECASDCGNDIAMKVLEGIRQEGFDYRGMLYIGLVLTTEGPKVIEFNARFGDPEAEVLLPRLDMDLLEILMAAEEKRLGEITLRWKPETAVCVVLASGGYPGVYETGYEITAIPETDGNAVIFHAGTRLKEGVTVTHGGRVLAVTALGADGAEARRNAYLLAAPVRFKDCHYRKDIGL